MLTQEQATELLLTAITADQNAFNAAVMRGLVAAGAEPRWDSSTIEAVLLPIQDYLKNLGIPKVGNTLEDLDAYEFWLAVDGQPLPWDPYQGDEEQARIDWRHDVVQDDTELGFRAWWDDKIETARHNL